MKQKKFLAVLLAAMFLSSLAFAAVTEERITLSTYYPAPYGVYEELFVSGTPSTTSGLGPSLTVDPVLTAGADGDVLKAVHIKPDFQYETGVDPDTVGRYGLIVEDGNVGIGTTTPNAKLDIEGSAHVGSGTYNAVLEYNSSNREMRIYSSDLISMGPPLPPNLLLFAGAWGTPSSPDPQLFLHRGGNVGIGTRTPATDAKLDIAGGDTAGLRIRARSETGAPTTGTWSQGTLIVDSMGILYICRVAGTPGAWVKVGLQT